MTDDDLLFRFRLRLFALAQELGSVRAACRALGVHPSTYYRWKRQVDRGGLEMLRPRERRAPRMPNATSVLVSQRIIAFALGHPGFGPARISAELARPLWGGLRVSATGVYRVLRRHGLGTRQKRLGLVAGYACPPEPLPREPEPERHIEVPTPDRWCRWTPLHRPALRHQGRGLAVHRHRRRLQLRLGRAAHHAANPDGALELASRGGGGPRSRLPRLGAGARHHRQRLRVPQPRVRETLTRLGAVHTFIRPGRPQSNGCVERVQRTILEECWKPSFARYLVPKYTGLRHDLRRYLSYYNSDRAHTGRLTRGRTPEEVLGKAKMWS